MRDSTPGDHGGAALVGQQGWLNADWANDQSRDSTLAHAANLLKLGPAGTLIGYPFPLRRASWCVATRSTAAASQPARRLRARAG